MASATSSPRPVVPAAAESRATTTAASPPRVLIADPDELIFGRLCAALHAAGYGADAVASARELPHRAKYLLLVTAHLRRLLDLHEQLVDEVERELG